MNHDELRDLLNSELRCAWHWMSGRPSVAWGTNSAPLHGSERFRVRGLALRAAYMRRLLIGPAAQRDRSWRI